jgi:hypothetical protein
MYSSSPQEPIPIEWLAGSISANYAQISEPTVPRSAIFFTGLNILEAIILTAQRQQPRSTIADVLGQLPSKSVTDAKIAIHKANLPVYGPNNGLRIKAAAVLEYTGYV